MNKSQCSKCGECCRFVDFKYPESTLPKKEVIEYYKLRNIEVIKSGKDIVYRVWSPCKHLTSEGLCSIFNKRPGLCRNTMMRRNVVHPEGCTDTVQASLPNLSAVGGSLYEKYKRG